MPSEVSWQKQTVHRLKSGNAVLDPEGSLKNMCMNTHLHTDAMRCNRAVYSKMIQVNNAEKIPKICFSSSSFQELKVMQFDARFLLQLFFLHCDSASEFVREFMLFFFFSNRRTLKNVFPVSSQLSSS